ncbi:SMC-Scp complex subunit ScpB [Bacterioplanoides sp. SCSIO 12839]|uniref:SMC-Scp complex subunit ScpB n=1 Tax=Bacterioplanoides sp. SCSIO 12839 TaxID=2829569 RepID=UPI00220E8B59|nr:SMC-Scp complex subunit ScpB [Bacterioplanoides sp. SCSIO 12839]
MSRPALKNILEAALMAAGGPLSLERMQTLFDHHEQPKSTELKQALTEIKHDLLGRGIELIEVASGYRLQVRSEVAPWVGRLWDERPQRYSRALLETLALIAYRQPITRGDIEDVRGVVVSSQMMKTLIERDWVRIVGYRDVPGRPAMYATTKEFLDYFGLKSLEDLPSLMEIRELEDTNRKLEFGDDAEARKETPKEYDFVSDEDVEERGASVLDATEEDLAKAAALVERVEANVFARPDDEDEAASEKPRDIGELLERLENVEKDRDLSDLVAQQEDLMAQQDAAISELPVPETTLPEAVVLEATEPEAVADTPKTLEDAQRARLLAEQQAIKDRIMQEIAAEQAAASADAEPEVLEPEVVESEIVEPEVVESDDHADMDAAEEQAERELLEELQLEQERLEQEKAEQERLEAEAEELLIQQEIEAEKALLAEEQAEKQAQENELSDDDSDSSSPSGPSLFG